MDSKYNVIFEGRAADGIDTETAKSNLQNLFKMDRAAIDKLFSGKRTVLKMDVSSELAKKYENALGKAGAAYSIEPVLSVLETPAIESEPSADADAAAANTAAGQAAGDGNQSVNPYAPPAQNAAVAKQVFCRSCGARIDATAETCPACGARQQVGKPKSKVVAALLAIFLGFIGAHRFYLGQWVGIFYIFLGGIGWLIAWVEAIVFLVTSREKWDQKYGNVVGGGAGLFIALGLAFLVVIGILAAIAIPAYNDYVQRARVLAAIDAGQPALDQIEAFAKLEGYFPDSADEGGVPTDLAGESLASLVVSANGVVTMRFTGNSEIIDGKTLLWVPALLGNTVQWDCSGGTLAREMRPARCQEGKNVGQQSSIRNRQVVADDDSVRVEVPAHWKPNPELNDIASIQYANLSREQYFIVISEPKSDFYADMDVFSYNNLLLENFRESLTDIQIKYLGEVEINDMAGLKHELRGRIDGLSVVYLLVALEGTDSYHQLVFWSTAARWKTGSNVFEEVLTSFAECPDGCAGEN